MKKILLWIVLVTLSSGVTVEQLFNIKTILVKKEHIETTKTYNGYAKMIDSKIYTITTTQNGFIQNLTAPNIYDRVTKGKKLFEIYSPKVYKAQIELLNAKTISQSLAKNIETKLKLYGISSSTIRAIKRSNRASKYLAYYSPYSGVVVDKKVTEGSAIKEGMSIYKIADLSKIWVVAKAYEKDREFIQKGQKVAISFSGDKKVYKSTIDFIYPFVDPINKTIDFRVTLDNPNEKIQPNSYATIKSVI
ncbi:MAG TPA: efflux RND transporter periplasmic adaptor subunit, partial [Campylobacterales bacterium]|nr:efflux RND transporter periplasmic adaptor subunit [Campylobacterales bacterium]